MNAIKWTMVVIAAAILGVITLNKAEAYECGAAVVVVQEGDTITSIVQDNCLTGNTQAAVDDVVSVYGPVIYPGQRIVLP